MAYNMHPQNKHGKTADWIYKENGNILRKKMV